MSHNLPVNTFEWVINTSQFNEDSIKNYYEESDEEYFHAVDVQRFENYIYFMITYHFCLKE